MHAILVVEDDPHLGALIRRLLEREQFVVHTAANGVQALQACKAMRFDLVLTDLLMPEKDGLELIVALRDQEFRGAVVAMSGGRREITAHFTLQSARLLGVTGVLAKPFSRQELLQAVRGALLLPYEASS